MMRWIALISLSVFFLGLVSGCSQNGKSVAIGKEENGTALEVKVGDEIAVTLEGNPTTGYTWEWLGEEAPILSAVGEPDYKSDSKLIGSGGIFKFTFKVTTSGEGTLHLIYHRTFEPDVAPLEEYTVSIRATE